MSSLAEIHARRALEQAGLDPAAPLVTLMSVNNQVWMTTEHVVRLNMSPTTRLQREARLTPTLPPEVSRPTLVASGNGVGREIEWQVAERVAGNPLSRVWTAMGSDERDRAMARLARSLKALHDSDAPAGLERGTALQLVDVASDHLRESALEVSRRRLLRPSAAFAVEHFIETHEAALAYAPPAHKLIHGDLVFENIMWDGREIYLLDFEFCRSAPRDVDLDILLRFCGYPQLHAPPDVAATLNASQFSDVPRRLQTSYPELFCGDYLFDRLRLYALGFELRTLLDPDQSPMALEFSNDRVEALLEGRSHLDWLRSTSPTRS
ncbi:MAG: aminoglycoside phosphotransferase family protein [Acidobacteria bacterium]|nr:aminoglycoside phosphotransferase family protein [Acidobacteriota bacterium]